MDRLTQSGVHVDLLALVDAGAPWNNAAFWADALPPPHEGKDEQGNPFADSEDIASNAIYRLQVCPTCICLPGWEHAEQWLLVTVWAVSAVAWQQSATATARAGSCCSSFVGSSHAFNS